MPGGDKCGPSGENLIKGRGLGYYRFYEAPGYKDMQPFFGRGFGFSRRRGGGMRRGMAFRPGRGARICWYPYEVSYSLESEANILRRQAKHLEDLLEQINKQLTQLEEQEKKDKNNQNNKEKTK